MDLIRTLMVYMMLLVGGSVQGTDVGAPMPTVSLPTATPYVYTMPPVTAAPTAFITPTPAPSYSTLYVGDRGADVRRMQVRLIELGYLPAGSADSVFGQATKSAVERFQTYNNLTVDGIAGKRTLRALYEDPNVVVAPVAVTTPTPTKRPVSVNVPVYYKSNTGTTLYRDTAICSYTGGYSFITANDSRVPAGYTLTGNRTVSVYVSAAGAATPSSVTFVYAPSATAPPTSVPSANVRVLYQTAAGLQLYQQTVRINYSGAYATITADDSLVPSGYQLTSERSVSVFVSSQGVATPSTVTFIYSYTVKPTQRVSVSVPVLYMSESNQVLFSTMQLCYAGQTNYVNANDEYVPIGYTLVSARTVAVLVSEFGVATPASVTYTYRAPSTPTPSPSPTPVKASLSVYYTSTTGDTVASPISITLEQGQHAIYADPFDLLPGYTLSGTNPQYVTVDSRGATPPTITFVYSASVPVTVDVTVQYRDREGHDIAKPQVVMLEEGLHVLYAQPDNLPGGYEPTGATDARVEVRGGVANPPLVTFIYQKAAPVLTAISGSCIKLGTGETVGDLRLYSTPSSSRPLVPLRALMQEMGWWSGVWDNGFSTQVSGVDLSVAVKGSDVSIIYGSTAVDMSSFSYVVDDYELYISWNIFEHILAVLPSLSGNVLTLTLF